MGGGGSKKAVVEEESCADPVVASKAGSFIPKTAVALLKGATLTDLCAASPATVISDELWASQAQGEERLSGDVKRDGWFWKRSLQGKNLPSAREADILSPSFCAVIMVLRRPGCPLCRAIAKKMWDLKPQLDALSPPVGIICIVQENLKEQIAEVRKEYWPGPLYLDNDLKVR